MPNWVFCNLSVSGEKDAVEQFDSEMRKPHPTFVAKPDEAWGHQDGMWQTTEGEKFSFWNAVAPTNLEHYFTGENWYNWNCANWGCKWDVDVEDEDSYESTDGSGDQNKMYRFDTAWSPPIEAFSAMCAKYTNLRFSLSYEEEQGWGGEVCSDDEGGIYVSEEYDIPSSHADYVARDREDSCNCMSGDDEEYWFDDCPREEEDENAVIVVEDLTTLVVS